MENDEYYHDVLQAKIDRCRQDRYNEDERLSQERYKREADGITWGMVKMFGWVLLGVFVYVVLAVVLGGME